MSKSRNPFQYLFERENRISDPWVHFCRAKCREDAERYGQRWYQRNWNPNSLENAEASDADINGKLWAVMVIPCYNGWDAEFNSLACAVEVKEKH